jgi:hypothetical protein
MAEELIILELLLHQEVIKQFYMIIIQLFTIPHMVIMTRSSVIMMIIMLIMSEVVDFWDDVIVLRSFKKEFIKVNSEFTVREFIRQDNRLKVDMC